VQALRDSIRDRPPRTTGSLTARVPTADSCFPTGGRFRKAKKVKKHRILSNFIKISSSRSRTWTAEPLLGSGATHQPQRGCECFSELPQNRHPERSASQIYRKQKGFKARSRRTPAMLVGRCSWELSGRKLHRKIKGHKL
jgi:hypothetical protein